jgi:xylitol oxidase
VSVAGLPAMMAIDTEGATVAVAAGVRYGELAVYLQEHGFALHNLGSLPHISIAGACATGTHGSGDRNGNLATAVAAMDVVTASGELIAMTRDADADRFLGAVVGLGALGIVSSMTLDVVPTFDVRQYVYDDMPLPALSENFEEIFSAAYSVSAFTTWRGPHIDQLWLKQRVQDGDASEPNREWLGATLADGPRHPLPGMPATYCTQQLGVPGAWYDRLPHFQLAFTPSSGEELQSEYLLPRSAAVDALAALSEIAPLIAAVLQISEIRTVAADELWMSPSYRRDTVAFHFTWVKDTEAIAPVLAAIEERLAPFDPRPHWGKLFGMPPAVVSGRYERRADFEKLVSTFDPTGKFRNAWFDEYFPVD